MSVYFNWKDFVAVSVYSIKNRGKKVVKVNVSTEMGRVEISTNVLGWCSKLMMSQMLACRTGEVSQ